MTIHVPEGAGAAAAAGAANAAAPALAVVASSFGAKSKDGLMEAQLYVIFKQYAGDDGTLDYDEFGRMLERFDIKMIEERRRRLFAR